MVGALSEDGKQHLGMRSIATHAEQGYAELIAASPAIGFLSKTTLSADAIRDLLADHGGPRP